MPLSAIDLEAPCMAEKKTQLWFSTAGSSLYLRWQDVPDTNGGDNLG